VGTIVEIDRSHLPVALRFPADARRFAAKVTSVSESADEPGWLFCTAFSSKRSCFVSFAVPPAGSTYDTEPNGKRRSVKVRIIR
jgi:hypothetical protein